MKVFSIYRSAPETFDVHPQEDYFLCSEKFPIFAVADGVTLTIPEGEKYPDVSGAGVAAKLFCKTVIDYCEKAYENFTEANILKAFDVANQAIGGYNKQQNLLPKNINFGTVDFFHITAVLAVIKDKNIFWGNICDAELSLVGKDGREKFSSPPCDARNQIKLPENWDEMSENEQATFMHEFVRNKLDKNGRPIGYGVLTGEKEALTYVNHGILKGEEGDILFVFSDGFRPYLELKEFLNIFIEWPSDIERKIEDLVMLKSKENTPRFGHERSLIVVKNIR